MSVCSPGCAVNRFLSEPGQIAASLIHRGLQIYKWTVTSVFNTEASLMLVTVVVLLEGLGSDEEYWYERGVSAVARLILLSSFPRGATSESLAALS
uniref:Macaca fascicularis brain cDNA, clone: QtrA-15833 n=1 Tax=Macaca fascicularis TaxID=9541 RepID=I7G4J3_MACFA|nr:unnamed protein product [Macaca fascicularis]